MTTAPSSKAKLNEAILLSIGLASLGSVYNPTDQICTSRSILYRAIVLQYQSLAGDRTRSRDLMLEITTGSRKEHNIVLSVIMHHIHG